MKKQTKDTVRFCEIHKTNYLVRKGCPYWSHDWDQKDHEWLRERNCFPPH